MERERVRKRDRERERDRKEREREREREPERESERNIHDIHEYIILSSGKRESTAKTFSAVRSPTNEISPTPSRAFEAAVLLSICNLPVCVSCACACLGIWKGRNKKKFRQGRKSGEWRSSGVATLLSICNLPVCVCVLVLEKGGERREIGK